MLAACTGDIGEAGQDGTASVPGGQGPSSLAGESVTGVGGMAFMRLSHTQWEAGAKLALRPVTPPAVSLPRIASTRFVFDTDELSLSVGEPTVNQFRDAAELYGDAAVADAQWMTRLLPAGAPATGSARTDAFVNALLLRTFRRPPTPDELQKFSALVAAGTGADDAERFKNGVRQAMVAALQMPDFSYRIGVGASEDIKASPVGGRIPLTAYELASRLSLALFDAPPDEAMLMSVGRGEWGSPDKYAARLDEALTDPRAKVGLLKFHEQLYFADQYAAQSKDIAKYPSFEAGLGSHLREDMLRTVEDVLSTGGGVSELLSTRIAFVNVHSARTYGLNVSDFSETYKRVELGPERAGVLTRAGWASWGAGTTERRQILRGLAMLHNVLCESYPTGEPQAFPATYAPELKTSRKRLESVVGSGSCKACHETIINPKGYLFEHFDAAGVYQTTDNTEPVDASGRITLDGIAVEFKDHTELMPKLAASKQAQTCYARRMSHYFWGYEHSTMEDVLVASVEKKLSTQHLSARDVARIVFANSAFTTRKMTEAVKP